MNIPAELYLLMSVDMDTVDRSRLIDIQTLEWDRMLPNETRFAFVKEKLGNPFCFRCGEVGVKLEYDDNVPPLQEVLTHFMIRKKSGI